MAKFWIDEVKREGQVIAYAVRTTTPHVSGIADGIVTIITYDARPSKVSAQCAANEMLRHLKTPV